jgi:hypothetical protein
MYNSRKEALRRWRRYCALCVGIILMMAVIVTLGVLAWLTSWLFGLPYTLIVLGVGWGTLVFAQEL